MPANAFAPVPMAFGLGRLRTDPLPLPPANLRQLVAPVSIFTLLWAQAKADFWAPADAITSPKAQDRAQRQRARAWQQLRAPGPRPQRRAGDIAALRHLGRSYGVGAWHGLQRGVVAMTLGSLWAIGHGASTLMLYVWRLLTGGSTSPLIQALQGAVAAELRTHLAAPEAAHGAALPAFAHRVLARDMWLPQQLQHRGRSCDGPWQSLYWLGASGSAAPATAMLAQLCDNDAVWARHAQALLLVDWRERVQSLLAQKPYARLAGPAQPLTQLHMTCAGPHLWRRDGQALLLQQTLHVGADASADLPPPRQLTRVLLQVSLRRPSAPGLPPLLGPIALTCHAGEVLYPPRTQ